MLIFNLIGLGMVVAGFAGAYALGWLLGGTGDDTLTATLGLLVFVLDLAYRASGGAGRHSLSGISSRRVALSPRLGGQLFFIPAWVFGLIWASLGTYRLLFGSD